MVRLLNALAPVLVAPDVLPTLALESTTRRTNRGPSRISLCIFFHFSMMACSRGVAAGETG